MKWYIIAALFLFVVIGVVMFLGLIHMPKWILKVHLKETENKKEIIKIRARLRKYEPQLLKNFLNNKLKIEINLRT